jgi:competence protein ComEC
MKADVTGFPFASFPAVRLLLCLMAGLVAAIPVPTHLLLGMVAGHIGLEGLLRWRLGTASYVAAILSSQALVVALGSWLATRPTPPTPPSPLDRHLGAEIAVEGIVRSLSRSARGSAIVLDLPAGERVRVRADSLHHRALPPGARVAARVRLSPPAARRNPHAFDFAGWLRRNGITHSGVLAGDPAVLRPPTGLDAWRHAVSETIRGQFSPANHDLALAILIGSKSGMDPDLRQSFARSGLSHLMAVSGMHVGFLLLPVWAVIPWIRQGRHGPAIGLAFLGGVLLLYAALTGFSASVNRAAIMAFAIGCVRLGQRPAESLNILAGAALLLLVAKPGYLADIGFQLSFSAVAIILLVMPAFTRLIPYRKQQTWPARIGLFLLVSTVVQAGLYPILAWHFGEFAWAGPIANLPGVPLTQFLFLWGFATLPVSAAWADLGRVLSMPADWAASSLAAASLLTNAMPYSWTAVPKPEPVVFGIWLAAVSLIAAGHRTRLRWTVLIGVLGGWCVHEAWSIVKSRQPPVLDVWVYDVGQGDAVLIRTPSGKSVLYDTGVISPGRDSGRDVVLPDLKARRIGVIERMILSHPHADHIGGARSVIEALDVEQVLHSGFPYPSAVELGWRMTARQRGVPADTARRGMQVSPDPAVSMRVLHPGPDPAGRDPNPYSVVLRIQYGTTSFLFTGDADAHAEAALTARYGSLLRADWLKAGHHGSKTSSTTPFLNLVAPAHVAVSLAAVNRYRHPHPEAVARLEATGAEIRFTSRHRALHYRSDGTTITRIEWTP